MSEVKRYVFGISRTEPGDRLTAGTVYVDEADYAALESKLAAVQAGADRLAEAARACEEAYHDTGDVSFTELFAALAAYQAGTGAVDDKK